MLFPCQHPTLVLHFVCELREPRHPQTSSPFCAAVRCSSRATASSAKLHRRSCEGRNPDFVRQDRRSVPQSVAAHGPRRPPQSSTVVPAKAGTPTFSVYFAVLPRSAFQVKRHGVPPHSPIVVPAKARTPTFSDKFAIEVAPGRVSFRNTRSLMLYCLACPSTKPDLCCQTRCTRSDVTPK